MILVNNFLRTCGYRKVVVTRYFNFKLPFYTFPPFVFGSVKTKMFWKRSSSITSSVFADITRLWWQGKSGQLITNLSVFFFSSSRKTSRNVKNKTITCIWIVSVFAVEFVWLCQMSKFNHQGVSDFPLRRIQLQV